MDKFIARQPIFDRKNRVVAYELLYRSGRENYYDGNDGEMATMSVISNSLYSSNVKAITNNTRAFINFTEKLILKEIATLLSPKDVVIEILETVEPNSEIIEACKNLKNKGFVIVLDDFIFHEKYIKLIELADIIKVDFRITQGIERKKIFKVLKINNKIKFLAEKVETTEEYIEALDLGYSYFQGYYFSKPVTMSTKQIPSNKYITLKIFNLLNKEDMDIDELEDLVLKDVGLSYKVLKLINSSAYAMISKVTSVKYAITLLGRKEIAKWLYVVLLNELNESNSNEIVKVALQRANFCENICKLSKYKRKAYSTYVTGLFSVMDAILNCPMEAVINDIYLPDEVKDALLGNKNVLNEILDLAINYEKGEWDRVVACSEKLQIDVNEISEIYLGSLEWSQNMS